MFPVDEKMIERTRQYLLAQRDGKGSFKRNPQALDSLCAVAGVAALRGDRAAALDHLDEAIDLGYSQAESLAGDSDFESLRADPVFIELVERARHNAAETGSS